MQGLWTPILPKWQIRENESGQAYNNNGSEPLL